MEQTKKKGKKKRRFGMRADAFTKRYLLIYTLLFAGMCFLVMSWIYTDRKTVLYEKDGWFQHYRALVYYGSYLRDIFKNLFSGNGLVIPHWEFALGEGNDLVTTLSYYVIGDPFTFGSVFVPTRFMLVYFTAMVVLRLYLAGLAFSALCFELGHRDTSACIAGSFTYIFATWGLEQLARHPYFLNPLIYLPLLILGFERMRKGKRATVFVLAVFFSTLSNFYFLYVLGILTVLYILLRVVTHYRHSIKKGFRLLGKTIVFGLLGMGMGAVLLFPVAYSFLTDARFDVQPMHYILYPIRYYSELPGMLIASDHYSDLFLGITIPAFLAIFLLFSRKGKDRFLKLLFIVCGIFVVIPFFGEMMNGFSYLTNRWSWAFVLLLAFNLTVQWRRLLRISKKQGVYLAICVLCFAVLCACLRFSREKINFFLLALGLVFIVLMVFMPNGEASSYHTQPKAKPRLAMGILCFCILANAWDFYDGYLGDLASEYEFESYFENAATAVASVMTEEEVAEGVRFSGQSFEKSKNANLLTGISSTQYFWSLTNPSLAEFRRALTLAQADHSIQDFHGYNARPGLLSLSSVGYYTLEHGGTIAVPYGFNFLTGVEYERWVELGEEDEEDEEATEEAEEEVEIKDGYKKETVTFDVYKNQYVLPYGYTYQSSLSRENWDALSSPAKEDAMLSAVVLEDTLAAIPNRKVEESAKEIKFTAEGNSEDVTVLENAVVVTKKDSKITLSFEGEANAETFLEFKNLHLTGTPVYELYFGDETVDPQNLYDENGWNELTKKHQEEIIRGKRYWREIERSKIFATTDGKQGTSLELHTPRYNFYSGQHDFTLNLGYQEEPVHSITIKFPDVGVYSFDSMRVLCEPMDDYVAKVEELASHGLTDIHFDTDEVSGSITASGDEVLCMSIPYSEGWEAYVDGEKVETFRANVKNIGVLLSEGTHEVVFRYHTPLLLAGELCSLLCAVIFIVYLRLGKKKKKVQTEGA